LTEQWWNWFFANYRTTIFTLGGIAAGITALTKTRVDDNLLAAIRKALPWNKAIKEDSNERPGAT
jgi:hypothetical protein